MKEIKFRAFHKPSKKIFDVYSFTDKEVFENSYDGIFTSDTLPALREDCILLQYTGLKDIDGKEIFEGHIVEIKFNDDYIDNNNEYIEISEGSIKKGLIIFDGGGFFFKLKTSEFLFLYDICRFDIEIKILESIYLNPELLELK